MRVLLGLGALFVAILSFGTCLKCAYESGEEEARRRYIDATRRVSDCRAAGGERGACEARFGVR